MRIGSGAARRPRRRGGHGRSQGGAADRLRRIDEYHRQVAERLIEQIEKGTAPWTQAWEPGEQSLPANVQTGKAYRGGNSVWLMSVAEQRGYDDHRPVVERRVFVGRRHPPTGGLRLHRDGEPEGAGVAVGIPHRVGHAVRARCRRRARQNTRGGIEAQAGNAGSEAVSQGAVAAAGRRQRQGADGGPCLVGLVAGCRVTETRLAIGGSRRCPP